MIIEVAWQENGGMAKIFHGWKICQLSLPARGFSDSIVKSALTIWEGL